MVAVQFAINSVPQIARIAVITITMNFIILFGFNFAIIVILKVSNFVLLLQMYCLYMLIASFSVAI